jgi:DNA-binding transcriptional regulator YdaS (Cro superfamily)
MDTPLAALWDAINKIGGQIKLADEIGIAPPSITGWILRGRAPVKRCAEIERITGIPCYRLRPDYFPPPATPGT